MSLSICRCDRVFLDLCITFSNDDGPAGSHTAPRIRPREVQTPETQVSSQTKDIITRSGPAKGAARQCSAFRLPAADRSLQLGDDAGSTDSPVRLRHGRAQDGSRYICISTKMRDKVVLHVCKPPRFPTPAEGHRGFPKSRLGRKSAPKRKRDELSTHQSAENSPEPLLAARASANALQMRVTVARLGGMGGRVGSPLPACSFFSKLTFWGGWRYHIPVISSCTKKAGGRAIR